MALLRIAAITSLVPLEELDRDPFLVDSRAQYAMCARWAAGHGHVITRELLLHGLPPGHAALWRDVDAGDVQAFVVPSERVLERALNPAAEFAAECARRGVPLETADAPEPAYDAETKARVHRRLSMPTAGYSGC
ncbi:hypothetical protein H9Y04_12530 [Streptomyces sp. TRM66268-LWL]|uniref:Uncharacterized protein n=1 Tax=Streptomyces polyasparticus TaxID=2767826 RepID=A0ABR7SFZ4_9ACTN|nr:hypothetical protein [Streptomyces polyasparticus]MBC9713396.1 hypothetical protein [Streptomyces polyasparticus]